MARQFKTTTILADSEGKGWVEAQLSEAQGFELKREVSGNLLLILLR